MIATLIAAAAALLGVLIGNVTALRSSRQEWNRTLTVEVIDEIAQVHEIAWLEIDSMAAQRLESRVRFRLTILGIDDQVVDELFEAVSDCQRTLYIQQESGEARSAGELALSVEQTVRLRDAQRALGKALNR